jgi:maltose O-acetyltransferase
LDYLWRVIGKALGSEVFPVPLRSKMMRWCGCNVSAAAIGIWGSGFFGSKNFTIASGVLINRHFYFDGSDRLTIGENVHIGPFVRVITGSHEVDANPLFRCGAHIPAPVSIEDGCWIGAGATILPGVTIARGCVIGAGSVVAKSTAPNGLYVGVPARRIRELPG